MKHALLSAALVMCLAASPAAASPGDPFGGSETGCFPTDKFGVACNERTRARRRPRAAIDAQNGEIHPFP
ncbi:MAG: hypothetical protein ABIR79_21685 [Candidatus Binatia bacterium]